MKKKTHIEFIVLFVIFLLFVSLRIINLSADPPNNLSTSSCGEFGDPGNYALNARNKVLFDRWELDEFNVMYISPVPHVFTYLSFLLLGTGMWQMNLVPLFFATGIFIMLYVLSGKYFPNARFLLLFLLTINYPFLIYSRIATRTMPMAFFALVAVFFYLEGIKKPKYFFLSGLFLWLSFMSKGKIVYFISAVIPLSFISTVLIRKELLNLKLNLKRLGFLISGVMILFIPWFLFIYEPNREFFTKFSMLNYIIMIPRTLHQAAVNWFLRPYFFFHWSNLILCGVLFVYFLYLLVYLFRNERREKSNYLLHLEIICAWWIIIGLFINSVINYRPIRHYIELTIPILILSTLIMSKVIGKSKKIIYQANISSKAFPFLFLIIWVSLTSFTGRLFTASEIKNNLGNVIIRMTVISIVVFFSFLLIYFLLHRKKITVNKKIVVFFIIILIGTYSIQNFKEYFNWIRNATYNLRIISKDLGKAFPGTVFCGLLAPSISMENRNIAYTSWTNFANDDRDFLKEKKVNYLFLGTFNREPAYYWKNFPDEMIRANLLAKYWIWRSWFLLYELGDKPPLSTKGVFEAEKIDREVGLPLFDLKASNRFSVFIDSGKKGIIGKENISSEKKQLMDFLIYLKLKQIEKNGPLLGVRIIKDGKIVYNKILGVEEEKSFVEYWPISFKYFFPEKGEYILELWSFGNLSFYLDKIVFEPIR